MAPWAWKRDPRQWSLRRRGGWMRWPTRRESHTEMTKLPMKRSVYVCSNNCGIAYHHPLVHCPRCPGKLVKRELPWDGAKNPKGYFEGVGATKKYDQWLAENKLELPK